MRTNEFFWRAGKVICESDFNAVLHRFVKAPRAFREIVAYLRDMRGFANSDQVKCRRKP